MTRDTSPVPRRAFAGSIALFLGVGLLLLILLDVACDLPWSMPPSWYEHRTLWGGLGLAFFAAGWLLQRAPDTRDANWKPAVRGGRFRSLVIYSRHACHLCDDAKAVLGEYLEYLPEIKDVDIDADPELKSRFDTMVPVVEIDGQIRFHGRVDEVLLRRLIEATPPV
jgi:glutaredoxin